MAEHTSLTLACQYQTLENGVHVFTFTETSVQAVDEWIVQLDRLYSQSAADEILRMLLDYSAGMLPLKYTFQKMNEFTKRHPQRPQVRTAFLHNRDFLVSMISTMVRMMPGSSRDKIRFFLRTNREEAMAWLLKHE